MARMRSMINVYKSEVRHNAYIIIHWSTKTQLRVWQSRLDNDITLRNKK